MTKRVAIWILGLFVFVSAHSTSYAADYYIMRGGDMLYRVPHSVYKKRSIVSHNMDARPPHFSPAPAKMSYIFAKVGGELHHLPCEYRGNGEVSYYGRGFHGKPMKNGRIFNKNKLTAAYYDERMVGKILFVEVNKMELRHPRYRGWGVDPEGAIALPITDTGSFKKKYGRSADLSQAAFIELAGGKEKFARVGILPAHVFVCDPNPVNLAALE